MKSFVALSLTMSLVACADSAAPEVDAIDASFLFGAKADGTGIAEGSADACAVLAAANGASEKDLDDAAGLDGRAAAGIVKKRPFTTLAALDAVAYVGPVAFKHLLSYASDAGYTCAAPTTPTTPATACSATGGTYDSVKFTVAAECKALAFLNGARMSDMRTMPDLARRSAYEHCTTSATCSGYRFSGWTSLAEFANWPKVANASMKALLADSKSWTATGGPAYDTIADVWARRSALDGVVATFEKVYVTRGDLSENGSSTYSCVEVRDAPDAPNYLHACIQFINADSAGGCSVDPKGCLDPYVGKWVWIRGTVRKTSAHPGGYKINLTTAGPHAANPALLTDVPAGPATTPVDTSPPGDAWRAAAIAAATKAVVDGPMPGAAPLRVPKQMQARIDVDNTTSEVSVVESHEWQLDGRNLFLVLATDGSGEGNLVWVDLIDENGVWFAHAIGHTVWDGGSGLNWSLDEEDTTICRCSDPGSKAVCLWLDGTRHASGAITCQ